MSNINAGNIVAGTIDASQITVTNIDADNISTGTLNADRIGANSIDAAKLNVVDLFAQSINVAGSIEGNYEAGVSGWKIDGNGDAEFSNVIARGSITTLQGSSIDGVYVSNINAGNIVAGTIDAGRINANSLDVSALPSISDEGLVALWRFDEGEGDTAVDSSGNTGDGELKNTIDNVNGVSGKALGLNGTSSYADISHKPFEEDVSEYSISMWFKLEDGGGGTDGRRFIYEFKNNWASGLSVNSSDQLEFYTQYSDNTSNILTNSGSNNIQYNTTYFVVINYKRNDTYTVYVNNEVWMTGNVRDQDLNSFTGFNIGTYRSANNRWFKGWIDEFRIYTRNLSANERKSLFLEPSGTSGGRISANQIVATEAFFNELFTKDATVLGTLSGNGWFIDENDWQHPSLGYVIYSPTSSATVTIGDEADALPSDYWRTQPSLDEPSESVTVTETKFKTRYQHKDSLRWIRLWGTYRINEFLSPGTAACVIEVGVSVGGSAGFHQQSGITGVMPDTPFVVDIDVSTLTDSTLYDLEVRARVQLNSTPNASMLNLARIELNVRRDIVIISSATTF